jgi:hypothetical protein
MTICKIVIPQKIGASKDSDVKEKPKFALPSNKASHAKEAASKGHIETLKYLHAKECPWDEEATKEAAANGHLECLKYLHENGCPWGTYTFYAAVRNGNLECLKYLHENGCSWIEQAKAHAAGEG